MWSSEANSAKRSRERYLSTRSWATPNKLIAVVSPLNRNSSPIPKKRRHENIDKFSQSFKSDNEFVSPISFPSSLMPSGSCNKLFTHSTPSRFVPSVSKNNSFDSKTSLQSLQSNDLILSPFIRERSTNASYRTVTDLNYLRSPVMTSQNFLTVMGMKSSNQSLNSELAKMNISQKLSPRKLSYKKSSCSLINKRKLTITPVKKNDSIMRGSTRTSTKTPLASFTQKITKIGTKSPNPSLNRELKKLEIDMNTFQELSPHTLSYKKSSSFSEMKPKKGTITPVKENDLIIHGSTRTSPTKTPLVFTQKRAVLGTKSPNLSLNRQLKKLEIDMNTSQELSPHKLSYKKSSSFSQMKPKKGTITPVKENDLIIHGSTRTSPTKTPLVFTQKRAVLGTKSPNLSLNRQLKKLEIDMNTSQKLSPRRSSFRKSSFPSFKPKERTITPVKGSDLTMHRSTRISAVETSLSFVEETSEENKAIKAFNLSNKSPFKIRKSIGQSSECSDATSNYEYENLKPQPKLDRNKKAALIACHKKKSPQKESIGEPSDQQSFQTVIGRKSPNLSLSRQLKQLEIDMNTSQKLSPRRSSYYRMKTSVSPIKRKKRTISPVKDNDLTIHGSTRISATETPLAFTQETNNKDELLKALNLSRKSDVIVKKQQPSRRLRSFNKTDSDSPTKKNSSKNISVNKGDEGIKTLFNDSDSYYTSGLKHLFYQSSNSISDLKNISCPKNRSNMNRVFTTSPVVDYTDVSGVKKLFTVSPKGDYRNPLGIKELFAREETYYMNSNNVRELFSDVPGPSGILTNSINDTNQHPKKAKIDKIFKKVQFEDDHLQGTEFLFSEVTSPVYISKKRKSLKSALLKSSKTKNNESVSSSRTIKKEVETKSNKSMQQRKENESSSTENIRKSTGMTPVGKRTRNGIKQKVISTEVKSPVKPKKVVQKEVMKSPELNKTRQKTPRTNGKSNVDSPTTPKKTAKNESGRSTSKSKETTPEASRKRGRPKKKISVAKTDLKIKTKSPTKPKKVVKIKINGEESKTRTKKITQQSNSCKSPMSKKTVKINENVSTANISKSEEISPVASRKRSRPKKKISVAKTVLKIKTKSPAKPKKIVKSKINSEESKTRTKKTTQQSNSCKSPKSKKTVKSNENESTANISKSEDISPAASRKRGPKKKISVAKTVLKIKTISPAKPKKVVKRKISTQECSNLKSPIRKTVKNMKNKSTASSSKSTPTASQKQTPKKKLSVAKTVLKINIKSQAKPKKVTNKVDKSPKPTAKKTKNSPKPKSPKKKITVKNVKSTIKGKATKKH